MVNFIFLVDIILQFVDRPRVAGVQLVDWCTRQPTRRAQKLGIVWDCTHGLTMCGKCSTSGWGTR